uniref:Conotoxin superfamily O1 n=1 Tax=Conus ermineus TaxID=55423 RepID=A0A346CJ41_CONER|nr:conotoxin precursor superfamily O1 [Conus ermineus]
MKLTCMIIVVLCLMACPLITADYPRASDLVNVAAYGKSSDPISRAIVCCIYGTCPDECR